MNPRARAVRALATVVYRSGLLRPMASVAARLRRTVSLPILTFHRVNDDQDPFFAALATSVFAARMEHIARHYTVLPVEELSERLREGRAPANALALTFDDGYRDSLTHAAPGVAVHLRRGPRPRAPPRRAAAGPPRPARDDLPHDRLRGHVGDPVVRPPRAGSQDDSP